MKFPEFIIAGFGRCGTSALLLNLGQHPDIQVALPNGTETRFWTNPLPFIKENLNNYKSKFYGKISGEKTPGYCLRPHILKTIHEYIPSVKIILCIRDPVNRALSHFELHKRFGRIDKNESFKFENHKLVINESTYINYIENCVLPSIPKDNIYFHVMEWAKKDFVKSIEKVYEFLGAEPYEVDVKYTTVLKGKSGEGHYMKLFNGNSDYHIWTQKSFVETPQTEKIKMYKFFKPHNEALFEFLGYEIKEWSIDYVNE